MINFASSGGVDDWQINFLDHSGPTVFTTHPTGTLHCDFAMRTRLTPW